MSLLNTYKYTKSATKWNCPTYQIKRFQKEWLRTCDNMYKQKYLQMWGYCCHCSTSVNCCQCSTSVNCCQCSTSVYCCQCSTSVNCYPCSTSVNCCQCSTSVNCCQCSTSINCCQCSTSVNCCQCCTSVNCCQCSTSVNYLNTSKDPSTQVFPTQTIMYNTQTKTKYIKQFIKSDGHRWWGKK